MYQTDEQALLIRKTFGCVRFVYNNKMLAEREETYALLPITKKSMSG
ncbi:Transposase, IS605 family [Shouchella clausii]|nr:Transposase, IS605 family [Shouchella clausii]